MKIIVCGGRNYGKRDAVFAALDRLNPSQVINGGATGADKLARDWAKIRRVPLLTVAADWDLFGRAAGPIRNSRMLELVPDAIVAFPGGSGTADMVAKAKARGVRIIDGERA